MRNTMNCGDVSCNAVPFMKASHIIKEIAV